MFPSPNQEASFQRRINVNSAKDPLLDSLDCPDPSVKMPRRSITTTPLQALGLMNNSFVSRQARHFAERVRHVAGLLAEGSHRYQPSVTR